MANFAQRLLKNELGLWSGKKAQNDDGEMYRVDGLVNDDLYLWNVTIFGPVGSPFENGKFHVRLTFSEEYPAKPPKVQFESRVWHPNINFTNGQLCVDLLKKSEWAALPHRNARAVMVSMHHFLVCPNPGSPMSGSHNVANQYIRNRSLYEMTVKFWTSFFAMPEKTAEQIEKDFPELEQSIRFVIAATSVLKTEAIFSLSQNNWTVSEAIDDLRNNNRW